MTRIQAPWYQVLYTWYLVYSSSTADDTLTTYQTAFVACCANERPINRQANTRCASGTSSSDITSTVQRSLQEACGCSRLQLATWTQLGKRTRGVYHDSTFGGRNINPNQQRTRTSMLWAKHEPPVVRPTTTELAIGVKSTA